MDHPRATAAISRVPVVRAAQVLAEVGLETAADPRAGKSSLGMRQRLGLAIAAAGRPCSAGPSCGGSAAFLAAQVPRMPGPGCSTGAIEGAQRQQGDAEVADPGEDTVQLRLVDDRPGQAGGAIVEADQGEVVEGGGPVIVEVTYDLDLVRRGAGHGRAGLARAGGARRGAVHVGAPTGALSVVVVLREWRRRMPGTN
jgi:hypothetical protein